MAISLLSNKFVLVILALAVGLGVGRFLTPAKEVTKTEIQEHEVIKKDIVTVIKEVVKTDGSKETTTTITDKTKEDTNKKESITVSTPVIKDWHIATRVEREHFDSANIYGLSVERRIIGNVFAGATVNTNNQYGLSVGIEF